MKGGVVRNTGGSAKNRESVRVFATQNETARQEKQRSPTKIDTGRIVAQETGSHGKKNEKLGGKVRGSLDKIRAQGVVTVRKAAESFVFSEPAIVKN